MKTQEARRRLGIRLAKKHHELSEAAAILRDVRHQQCYGQFTVQHPGHSAYCAAGVLHIRGWGKGEDVFRKLAALTLGEVCPKCLWVDKAMEDGMPICNLVVHLNDAHQMTFRGIAEVVEKIAATGVEGNRYTYLD
jgi:hypothetical protein